MKSVRSCRKRNNVRHTVVAGKCSKMDTLCGYLDISKIYPQTALLEINQI